MSQASAHLGNGVTSISSAMTIFGPLLCRQILQTNASGSNINGHDPIVHAAGSANDVSSFGLVDMTLD